MTALTRGDLQPGRRQRLYYVGALLETVRAVPDSPRAKMDHLPVDGSTVARFRAEVFAVGGESANTHPLQA